MPTISRLRALWKNLTQRGRSERDLDDEIKGTFDLLVTEKIEAGFTPDAARRAASLELGGVEQVKEQVRDAKVGIFVDSMLQDLRYAARSLGKNPGFVTAAILTLALGIGANTAIFSVVYGVVLRPLPYRDPDRLVAIEAQGDLAGLRGRTNYSFSDLADWLRNSPSLESIAFSSGQVYALSGDEGAEMVPSAVVTSAFFSTLDGRFALGRPLGRSDDLQPAVVISERLWHRRFNASPDVLGHQIKLSGGGIAKLYTIVGVADASFLFPNPRTDLWTSAGFWVRELNPTAAEPGARGFNPVARLKVGTTIEQAHTDAERVSAIINRTRLPNGEKLAANVIGLRESVANTAKPALLVLFAAVALVLLVACANVANLLLMRGAVRARELAIRSALGASRGRLMRQALIETGVLATAGATTGLLFAHWGLQALIWFEPSEVPQLDSIRIDGLALVFLAIATILTTLLSGLLPAIQASGAAANHGLRSTASYVPGLSGRRLRATLVVAELAISVVLLIGAVLLGRSLGHLLRVDNIGVRSDGVIAGEMNLSMSRTLTGEEQIALVDRLVERIAVVPSVTATGVGNGLPPNGFRMRFLLKQPDPVDGHERQLQFGLVPTTAGFFKALGVTLVHGRYFADSDRAGTPPVMVLSVSAARTLFGTTDVVGRTLPSPKSATEHGDVAIVGIVGDVKYSGLDSEFKEAVYRPFAQYPFRNVFLVTRTTSSPEALTQTIRRAVAQVDPEITITNMQALDAVISRAAAQPRFRTVVWQTLAGLALVLAVIGLFGVVSYAVAQRTNEIGIRMALGANRAHVMKSVLGEAMSLAIAGAALGVVSAYALSRMLTRFLYGITPTDPTSYGVAAGSLIAVAILASYVPARRATLINPAAALRCE